MGRFDSCLICATPRTGSTLLCGLLASTKVAGQPESYFREPDEQLWAARWGIARSPDEAFARSPDEAFARSPDEAFAWRAWFASVGVRPRVVRYEDLDADPAATAREILDFLGLELPSGRPIETRNRRLADELNARWIDRYRAEAAAANPL